MRQKEATIERYRACVASLRSEMQQQNQKLSAEAHVLRVKLLDTASVREKSQQDGDDAAHDKPRHFQDKVRRHINNLLAACMCYYLVVKDSP